mgnify:FL=1
MSASHVSDGDLIDLNVGGQRFTTTRSTLCQVEGSLLASMFSGRWEDCLKRDKDGAVFFDFSPQYFVPILDYLRARKIASADNPAPLPTVPEDQLINFINLVKYLGLRDEVIPTYQALSSDKFNSHSTNVILQEEQRLAVRDQNFGHGYVLGENVYSQGIANLNLKLETFKYNRWMFVGIVKDDAMTCLSENSSSCECPGSYGWTLGSDSGRTWKDGIWTENPTLTSLCKQGDTVRLILDCEVGKLSLYLSTGHEFNIEIPKSQSWRLKVILCDRNDKIRIV